MILTGTEIIRNFHLGKIKIDPFNESRATTNSYDLKLGNRFIIYKSKIIDPKQKPEYELIKASRRGILLNKGQFILGETKEKLGSDHFVPIVHAKSGVARMGLFVHVTADIIDIGSYGNSTLQLYATLPVKLYPDMDIAQVSFWVPKGKITLYEGKYQHSDGPQASKIWMSMKK
ncbi:MAG: Deoxycytidine triphosphate deaminase [Microgenomates group bacterium GW2011_GWC1_37_8]|uniref:Deoxycytidine triphosphate deaminase n=1 Tax=Candidatus Woesebacteria bacterium GW2011_GWB1_38_8 TaxID=1618570 RepID=A0A0G0L2V9_9BACT|nr:MAG: Deoxycytidine triphosphate deaminase [Microgenomates group bacterium GW2011_GWC1_37_8]KKQ85347.1 MAG: hypothetical protein UT08_C0007G0020 [Candidatus Woesebacteria bacterium GW2011_GWB1_38_8]